MVIVRFNDVGYTEFRKYLVQTGNYHFGRGGVHNIDNGISWIVVCDYKEVTFVNRSLKSTLTSRQAEVGSGDICRGSRCVTGVDTWQARQGFTFFSVNWLMPGNQTLSHNRAFVLTIPWWPSCARSTTRCCSRCGITIFVPRRMTFDDILMVNSSLIFSSAS